MSRYIWTLMLGLVLTASGCEPKPADQAPGRVTSQGVHRDFEKALDTTGKSVSQTKEDFQRSLHARLIELKFEISKIR